MSTLSVDCSKEAAIVQDLTTADRLQYYEQELERISEITEDFDDCKWVYEALVQYTTEYSQLKGVPASTQADMGKWLEKLGQLDPMRSGRWDDMRSSLKL
jgi:geranylgeranyl transferase type-2 subunit alpha